ncbi:MAG: PAS domain S-box protein [Candidatus Competibacter sp.]|nr:PAS domain S-box protein [Candidatus Competibacter sp.]
MQKPEFPADEAQRLQALRALEVLDTLPEERYDRLTRIARRMFKTSITLVSLVDAERQWFKSRQGLDATETPRDISFCGHAILENRIFHIPDATQDPRFADNPLVAGAPNIRLYAGAPLSTVDGHRVGTLCIIDDQPRHLTAEELQALRDLADCVEMEIQQAHIHQATDTLRHWEHYLHTVLNTVIDGVITIDERGIIQSFNRAAERIFSYTAAEVIGKNVNMLMPEPYHSEHDGYLTRYQATGEARIIGIGREVVGRRRDGSTFPMDLAVGAAMLEGAPLFTGVVRDLSERQQAERRLDEISRLRQAILDSANVFIISTDTEGVIRIFNKAAQRMLGYTEEEMVGNATPALIHDLGEVTAHAKALSKELGCPIEPGFEVFVAKPRRGQADENEWTYIRKDGSRFPVLLTVTALRDPHGEITGFLGIGSDITERKKVERMKSEFVSTVSHELRTPLTSIRGALGLILGKASAGLSAKVRQLLETANRNSERLTLLINDILDLEKIESGRLEFIFKPLDLSALARQALAANEGYAQQHGVRLRLSEDVSQATVWGDEHRLLQVFANLLSNAIKYSSEGGAVVISVQPTDNARFRVCVKDRGRGIPAAFRDRIFQRFAQADSSDTREKGGTGLGLSITKAIVERHGGCIDYHSQEGVSTEFFFELPEWREVVETTHTDLARSRALICEDNPDVASILAALLEQEGLACDIAATAAAARSLLAKTSYRALLLDLTLPDGDGLSMIRQLREDETTREVPIIVISGRAEEGRNAWSGDALTVVDWLRKPVDREQLAHALRQALRQGRFPRILHVEDDPDIIQITQALTEEAAEYAFATSLHEARQRLHAEHFDLVILDITLPDGSGLSLLDEIGSDCQVMLFSGLESNTELSAQIAAVLVKSKTSNERLLATIKQLIH